MSVETLVGIDVGSKELVVALRQGKTSSLLHFRNDSDGHSKLCVPLYSSDFGIVDHGFRSAQRGSTPAP